MIKLRDLGISGLCSIHTSFCSTTTAPKRVVFMLAWFGESVGVNCGRERWPVPRCVVPLLKEFDRSNTLKPYRSALTEELE